MTDFLIKSTVSLLVFLVFYHWVLEREKTHLFNRFYLLLAIVISLAIPFLSFEIIEEVPVTTITEPEFVPIPFSNENIAVVETIDYTSIAVWSLYSIITLLLSIRFGKNIWKLISKSDSNPTVKYKNATLVLVDEKTLPHTFLNNIFINFDDYGTVSGLVQAVLEIADDPVAMDRMRSIVPLSEIRSKASRATA